MLQYHLSRRDTAPQWYLEIYQPQDNQFNSQFWRYQNYCQPQFMRKVSNLDTKLVLGMLSRHMVKTMHVMQYTNLFDETIHEELKRQRRVIHHSFNALYKYSPLIAQDEVVIADRQVLESVVRENLLNQTENVEQDQVDRICSYIEKSLKEEDFWSYSHRIESFYDVQSVE